MVLLLFYKAPATEDFEVTDSGAFMLKRRLNYNAVQNYHFTVTAKVIKNYFEQLILIKTELLESRKYEYCLAILHCRIKKD